MEIIPAEPGWNVVSPQVLNPKYITRDGVYRQPVIAWKLEDNGNRGTVFPTTIDGDVFTEDIMFEIPDNTFVMQGVSHWRDDEDVLKFFKDMLEDE